MDIIKEHIRDIPDFPKPGIIFKDITPILANAKAFNYAIDQIAERTLKINANVIVGIESRGFIFGAPVAAKLKIPFVPIRKPGKLPADKLSVEYALEYGTGTLDIHKDAISSNHRVAIIDDLLATGGTAQAGAKLVEMLNGNVAGFIFVIELKFLKGRNILKNYLVDSLVDY